MGIESNSNTREYTAVEATIINQAEIYVDGIEKLSEEISSKEMLQINNIIENMNNLVIPAMLKVNLVEESKKYTTYIRSIDVDLSTQASKYMKDLVSGSYTLTIEQTEEWQKVIDIIKTKILPRLEKEGLSDMAKELEGAVMQSEIKIAHDSPITQEYKEKMS